ncbi:MAG: PorP/SprF family type IX secretion system membrane protein [Bacteroidota bacterium]
MRKLISIVVVIFSIFSLSYSQEDPQYSMNFYNQLSFNPGYAGSNDAICGVILYRNQWMGFDGAPKTMAFTVHGPIEQISSGAGISVVNDKIGYFNDLYFTLNYAYRLELDNGMLGMGLGIGFINKALSNADWKSPDVLSGTYQDPYDDPNIPHDGSKFSFDSNFGLYYQGDIGRDDAIYGGISVTHLNKPSTKIDKTNADAEHSFYARHFYILAGYGLKVSEKVDFQPGFIIHSDGSVVQYNVFGRAVLMKQFWGGLGFRGGDAIYPMFGYNHPSGLGGGVSYDITLSKLASYSSGTLEIYLRYCFNIEIDKGRGSYKSVRFL